MGQQSMEVAQRHPEEADLKGGAVGFHGHQSSGGGLWDTK
jgi:hypothetical protein